MPYDHLPWAGSADSGVRAAFTAESQANQSWAKMVTWHPDTMCSFSVVPDISYLVHTVTSGEVSNMIGVSGAPITAVGKMLVTGIDALGNAYTINVTNVQVVPSCPVALLGNHVQELGIRFIQNEETQWVNFGPIRVPARYKDLLLHSEFIVHGQSPTPVAGDRLPPLMTPLAWVVTSRSLNTMAASVAPLPHCRRIS